MSERRYDEKEEKQEKQEEKEEKSWEEKWRRDPLSAAVWAGILIWAGLVWLAINLKLLDVDAWSLIFLGAGLLVLLEAAVRLLVPAYRRPVAGTFILGVVLLGIGLGILVGVELVWPFVVIVIGVGLLLRGLLGRR